MPDSGHDSGGMSPLQTLVIEQMRRHGWGPKDVEDRGVAHATLHRYMNPVKLSQLPRRSVRQSLADALGVPFDRVTEAAMASIDWSPERQDLRHGAPTSALVSQPGDSVLSAIEHDPLLLPEAKEHLQRQYLLLKRLSPDPETTAIQQAVTEELAEEAGVRPIAPRTSPDCRR